MVTKKKAEKKVSKKKKTTKRARGKQVEITEEVVTKLLDVVDQGLCSGMGTPQPGHMCVEAAVCYVLGQPHGDKPSCVHPVVRQFKIALNDKNWSSEQARAQGMRRVAVAQLGSLDIDGKAFMKYVSEQTIRRIVPIALRAIGLETEAKRCEDEGTQEASRAGAVKAREVWSSRRAAADAYAAAAAYAYAYAAAADAAAYAAYAAAAAYAYAYAAAADAAAYAADACAYAAYAYAAAADAAAYAADAYAAAADAAAAAKKKRDSVLALAAEIAVEALIAAGTLGAAYLHLCK